ncbi:unnamed protein product [Paramecium sonneborni]|uniref:Uncharacterized protein n=1 Tax=Paramecium sonneborni TaxID=65129 RepID=A0A8S1P5Z0_9CILI|nr:unnamed protein product [Paramecium sonneborni]
MIYRDQQLFNYDIQERELEELMSINKKFREINNKYIIFSKFMKNQYIFIKEMKNENNCQNERIQQRIIIVQENKRWFESLVEQSLKKQKVEYKQNYIDILQQTYIFLINRQGLDVIE